MPLPVIIGIGCDRFFICDEYCMAILPEIQFMSDAESNTVSTIFLKGLVISMVVEYNGIFNVVFSNWKSLVLLYLGWFNNIFDSL